MSTRVMEPRWYVVLCRKEPPSAAPFASETTAQRFWYDQRAAGFLPELVAVAGEDGEVDAPRKRLLEALVAGPAEQRMASLVALNQRVLSTDPWTGSFWGCSQCDGDLDRPTQCGCCGSPDCSVRCGCHCPSEYWCEKCQCSHANPCVGLDTIEGVKGRQM